MKIHGANTVAAAGARVALRSFGLELRNARIPVGLRQEDVAAKLGVSTQTVRNWESGRVEPSEENKQRLGELLSEQLGDFAAFYEDLHSYHPKRKEPVVNGRLMREARREAGFTQAQAAERVGLSRFSIVRYETGASRPSDDTLSKLSEIYGKRSDWFLVDELGIPLATEDRTERVQGTATPAAKARIALEAAISELPDGVIDEITRHIGATRLFNRLGGPDAR